MALTKPKTTSFDFTTSKISSDSIKALGIENASFADLSVTVDKANLTGVSYPGFEEDVALLGFKIAANGSLGKYDLVDQAIDAFEDASGVDASASTDEIRNTAKYYSGSQAGNYYGDGSLGNCQFTSSTITQSSNTTAINTVLARGSTSGPVASNYGNTAGMKNDADDSHYSNYYETSVANGTASAGSGTGASSGSNINMDGDMVVLNFKDLTIDQGVCLTPTHPCRGMLVYVNGNCTINGGLSMSSRGAHADPTTSGAGDSSAVSATGIRLPIVKTGGTSTLAAADFAGSGTASVAAVANQAGISGNGEIITFGRAGSAGGAGVTAGYNVVGTNGTAGSNGATLSTAGGGAGGVHNTSGFTTPAGRPGTVFSGGSGGGGSRGAQGVIGVANGGRGGEGRGGSPAESVGAGAGNPAGRRYYGGSYQANGTADGTGGLLILLVSGNLTLGSNGQIDAQGQISQGTGGGGGSGGGSMFLGYAGTLTNSGEIKVDNQDQSGDTSNRGGMGGNAGLYNTQIAGPEAFNNMTLVSNATTAQSAPTKGDVVMTYSNGAGTAVINTDITAEFSADNGSTWTAMTLASQGTTGGHTILSAHDVTRTSTSGTSMRYRVKTLNQSVSKQTRVHAVSLGWS